MTGEKMIDVIIEGLRGDKSRSEVMHLGNHQGLEIFVDPDKYVGFAIAYKIKKESIKYDENNTPILSFMDLYLDNEFVQNKGDKFYRHLNDLRGLNNGRK